MIGRLRTYVLQYGSLLYPLYVFMVSFRPQVSQEKHALCHVWEGGGEVRGGRRGRRGGREGKGYLEV